MRDYNRWLVTLSAGALAALAPLGAIPAAATTLPDMITAVRAGNPDIEAQRAQLASDVADIAVVRAPARPKIQASGQFTQGTQGANVSSGFDRTFDGNLLASMPIYDGGAVHYGVAQQRMKVAGSQADADAMENRVLTDAITAYLDIVRDRQIVSLNEANLDLLEQDLAASRVRLKEGDVTRTDVAQTESRHAQAISRLATARTELAISETTYQRLVGAEPGELAPPPALPAFPGESQDVEAKALARNPSLISAQAATAAAREGIRVARAASRPTLTVSGGGEYHNYAQSPVGYPVERGKGAEVTGSLSYAIYQGGLVRGQVKQARALAVKAGFEQESASRQVAADARIALVRYDTSRRIIAQSEQAVALEQDALKGTRIEAKGGERSVLDVLNAEVELLDTQISLVNARHDSYVAGVGVMAAMNLLDCFGSPAQAVCR